MALGWRSGDIEEMEESKMMSSWLPTEWCEKLVQDEKYICDFCKAKQV